MALVVSVSSSVDEMVFMWCIAAVCGIQ